MLQITHFVHIENISLFSSGVVSKEILRVINRSLRCAVYIACFLSNTLSIEGCVEHSSSTFLSSFFFTDHLGCPLMEQT